MPRTVPVSLTETPGNTLTGAVWNAQVKALIDFLTNPPVFFGYQTIGQPIANTGWTSIALDAEIADTDGGHSTSTNTSRYVCQVAGLYRVSGTIPYVGNTAGYRSIRFLVNGGTSVTGSENRAAPQSATSMTASDIFVRLNVNDYIEMQGAQTSAASLNTNINSDYAPSMRLQWVSI